MNRIEQILRADQSRRTRFHDGKDRLHLSWDLPRALWTTVARRAFGHYPSLPWLTYPAIAELRQIVRGRRVFEFGAGTSTKWFSRHAAEVVSVENDPVWYERLRKDLSGRSNLTLIYCDSEYEFINEISRHEAFDIYLIDCVSRPEYNLNTENLRITALESSVLHGLKTSIYVIDNTDVSPRLDERLLQLAGARTVSRLAGWAPGILHPNETTILSGQ
jgi:hypothetical protein